MRAIVMSCHGSCSSVQYNIIVREVNPEEERRFVCSSIIFVNLDRRVSQGMMTKVKQAVDTSLFYSTILSNHLFVSDNTAEQGHE